MGEQVLNILLVDDDELLLKALSRSLSRLYENTVIVCLETPEDFESCIVDQGEPDILLCEEHLHGSFGHDVLIAARMLCPRAIRCLFSDNLQQECKWQIDNTIHFHLAKPYTPAHLSKVVDSALTLKSLPINDAIRVKLGQLSGLPCLNSNVSELLELLNEGSANVNELAELVNHDPILVSKLLQIANSAFMGFQSTTQDVKEAITRIGLTAFTAVVTCYEISNVFINQLRQSEIELIMDTAFSKAVMGQSLSRCLGQDLQEQQKVFACCLLSAIGVLTKESVLNDERLCTKVSCYDIGAYLLALWGYDQELVRAQLVEQIPIEPVISVVVMHALVEQLTLNKAFNISAQLTSILYTCGEFNNVKQWYNNF
ncbi:HDOD domain-containing protein [Pseudoalteromonas sp. JBTF-M23]|uniref:HDOD domain-containing protein n=1 Tax=Pseudoalteromonas caenipelagi TaxID=2726988 RepID=A0A849VHX0_9GAMM|nr:HDOD domain-containing protein [Pseudoalteromonas caenipelagi]NOU52298.1 HDOD domain-containing protein [Pseudoalteromonas caenipelagi]